jgi:hypothetical protein
MSACSVFKGPVGADLRRLSAFIFAGETPDFLVKMMKINEYSTM